jgi:hypothetical protein
MLQLIKIKPQRCRKPTSILQKATGRWEFKNKCRRIKLWKESSKTNYI